MKLTIVVPCYNEEEMLPKTTEVLLRVAADVDRECGTATDVLYIDDGSSDRTWELVLQHAEEHPNVHGLKLSSKSKYKQEVDTGKKIEKDKRKNTLPTAGVLLGGAFDIGYAFNSHFTVDIRVVQYLSNLVNEKAVAETEIMDSKLYTFHTTLGISFAL